jgi:predicted secreted protein
MRYFVLLLAMLALPAQAETILRLSETGTVSVRPDRLVASLRAEADGTTAADTQGKVNAAITLAVDLAKKTSGVTVATTGYNVWQVAATPQAAKHWHGSQGIDITGSDGPVLLTLVGTLQGQNLALQQLGWHMAPPTARAAQAEATRLAITQLRGRAEDAAASLGLVFVSFRTVNLDPGTGPIPRTMMAMAMPAPAMGAAIPPPVAEATDVNVEARVEAEIVLDVKK